MKKTLISDIGAGSFSAQDITTVLKTSFGRFPQASRILARIQKLLNSPIASHEAENFILIGESGVGKSMLLRRVADANPPIIHERLTEVPVLYASVPAKSNVERIASTMLYSLGSPYWDKGKERQLTIQLKTLIKACKVKLVILDEVNHLVDKGGIKTHHLIADWLKQLSDDVGIPFILCGIPRAERLVQANDQLRSRFREVITLQPFSVEDDLHMIEMRRVLKTFSGWMSCIPAVDMSSPHMARIFAFATAGRLRDIRRLFVRSVEITCDQSAPHLNEAVLAQAFREVIFPGADDERNPFTNKFKPLPLTKPGEPFAEREE